MDERTATTLRQPAVDVRRILELGLWAPSGGNFQPWKLLVKGNVIHHRNAVERTHEPYGVDYVGHGAFIESVILAASRYGYATAVELLPDPKDPSLMSKMELFPAKEPYQYGALAQFLEQRCCNRRPYERRPLVPEELSELRAAVGPVQGVQLLILEDRSQMERLSYPLSLNEALIFENRTLHAVAMRHFRLTHREHETLRDGLYLKTLELPVPARVLFRTLLRWWPSVRVLRAIGMQRKVAQEVGVTARSASAIAALVVSQSDAKSFLEAGRALMRVWLSATKLGIAIHPYAGLPIWYIRLEQGANLPFSPDQQRQIREAGLVLKETFGISEGSIAFAFRMGFAKPPSARSLRLPLDRVATFEPQEKRT